MKRKGLVIGMVAAALLWVGGVWTLSAAPAGPPTITLPAKMGQVTFPHEKHTRAVKGCKTCHHAGNEGQACRTCHKPAAEKGTLSAKDAFHKQCINCHKTQAKGPTKCAACHKR